MPTTRDDRTARVTRAVPYEAFLRPLYRAIDEFRHYPGKHDQKTHGIWAKALPDYSPTKQQPAAQATTEQDTTTPPTGSSCLAPKDWHSDGSPAARRVEGLRGLARQADALKADADAALAAWHASQQACLKADLAGDLPALDAAIAVEGRQRALAEQAHTAYRDFQAQAPAKAASILRVPEDRRGEFLATSVHTTGKRLYQTAPKHITDGNAFLSMVIDYEHLGIDRQTMPVVYHSASKTLRAYFNPDTGSIHLANPTVEKASTYIHEAGHLIGHLNPDVLGLSIAWRNARAGDEAPRSLNTITKSSRYRANEVGVADDFRQGHEYTGKVYVSSSGRREYATEVLATGLEGLYTDPVAFAVGDPGHAQYILSVIQGGGE